MSDNSCMDKLCRHFKIIYTHIYDTFKNYQTCFVRLLKALCGVSTIKTKNKEYI